MKFITYPTIFSRPPWTLLRHPHPRLLIFRFEEASLTLPQCYVENKKCYTKK